MIWIVIVVAGIIVLAVLVAAIWVAMVLLTETGQQMDDVEEFWDPNA